MFLNEPVSNGRTVVWFGCRQIGAMTLRRGANTSYRLNIKQQILNNSCYYYVICKQTPRRRVASVLSSSTYAVAGGTTPPTRRPCKCPFAVVRDDPLTHIRLVRRARPSRPRQRVHVPANAAVLSSQSLQQKRAVRLVTIHTLQYRHYSASSLALARPAVIMQSPRLALLTVSRVACFSFFFSLSFSFFFSFFIFRPTQTYFST